MNSRAARISVIISAFEPGDGLDRVIGSLDAQTLPQDEFETIIVDDGSSDDTFERLERYASTRPNLRIDRIENTGWASGPRNHAIEMATGEYVLFVDHDDYVYPDGLRRSYEFAREHDSDIVSAKEIKSNNVGFGFGAFLENIGNAVPDPGITALLPMLPHKFYRRSMLIEHGMRFPQGRRMLWEDIYFNVAAYRHSRVVSVLADTPVYRWTITGGNSSSTYGPRSEEYWHRLTELMTYIDEQLAGPELQTERQAMLLQQYRVRILNRFHPLLQQPDDPQIPMAMSHVRTLLERFLPEAWDASLGSFDRAKSVLIRQGRVDLLRQLHHVQSNAAGRATVDLLAWDGDRLRMRLTTRWEAEDGHPLLLASRKGRVLRRLPGAVARALPAELLDITDAVAEASTLVTVQNRSGREPWAVPTTGTVVLEPAGRGLVTPVMRSEAVVDVGTGAYGKPLAAVTWDFHARVTLSDVVNHRPLRSRLPAAPAVAHGRPVAVYANTRGGLSIDLGHRLRSIAKDGRPALDDVRGSIAAFTVPLAGVHVGSPAWIDAELLAAPVGGDPAVDGVPLTGVLIADERGARLEFGGDLNPGIYRTAVRLDGREALITTWLLDVGRDGTVTMRRQAAPPSPGKPKPSDLMALRDRLVRRAVRTGKRVLKR